MVFCSKCGHRLLNCNCPAGPTPPYHFVDLVETGYRDPILPPMQYIPPQLPIRLDPIHGDLNNKDFNRGYEAGYNYARDAGRWDGFGWGVCAGMVAGVIITAMVVGLL